MRTEVFLKIPLKAFRKFGPAVRQNPESDRLEMKRRLVHVDTPAVLFHVGQHGGCLVADECGLLTPSA